MGYAHTRHHGHGAHYCLRASHGVLARGCLVPGPPCLALAGERGARLARETEAFATIANSVACRTAVFDELISSTVKRESIELIINLAAGLDTRPFRLELPSGLLWVDVDRGSILEYKRYRLTGADPTCEYQQCCADLTKPPELHRVLEHAHDGRRTLVFTEGLLVYLSEPRLRNWRRAFIRAPASNGGSLTLPARAPWT